MKPRGIAKQFRRSGEPGVMSQRREGLDRLGNIALRHVLDGAG
jgi:hypothetical protein